MPFHNPYHFVPVQAEASPDEMMVTDFKSGATGHVTHDRYVHETSASQQPVYAGRLLCRVVTESPVVIGDRREELEDGSHRVTWFLLNKQPAIPASTLRGLISSVAETASNSALRVLENRAFSYRVEMRESLQALGLIVPGTSAKGQPELRLRPIALPPLSWNDKTLCGLIPTEYQTMFQAPLLKVYLDGYRRKGGVQPPEIEMQPGSFLQVMNPDSYSADHTAFWYLKLSGTCKICGVTVTTGMPHISRGQLLGQKAIAGAQPISQAAYDHLPPHEQADYTRGILRVLGIEGRTKEIPDRKTHEIFIPYPTAVQSLPTYSAKDAIKAFETLAAERTASDPALPFHLKGSQRHSDPHKHTVELRAGDVVFFRPDPSDPSRVGEVSISSIWRRRAGGTSHDFFRHLSKEKLPFNPERDRLSIAEQLFGFVEQSSEESADRDAQALASRLRFSFGNLANKQQATFESEATLKILASPKPPSPALYFKWHRERKKPVDKDKLDLKWHAPQGRKFYLHRGKVTRQQWETQVEESEDKNLKQKSRVTPLSSGAVFYFHIDFDNLSQQELSLLCYAIRPAPAFRHKLGMGKPLGLGQVRLDPVGLFYIDRQQRYRETSLFEAPRYHGCWLAEERQVEQWPDRYRFEREMSQPSPDGMHHEKFPAFDTLRDQYRTLIEAKYADILRALELLGNPDNVSHQVHYPQIDGVRGADMEAESFRWFVANDSQHEQLEPLTAKTPRLPTLPYHPGRG